MKRCGFSSLRLVLACVLISFFGGAVAWAQTAPARLSGGFCTSANAAGVKCQCSNWPGYCISAGNREFTYFKIGEDLVRYVAPDANIDLEVVEGGSIINVKRQRYQHGMKFVIVQSDVLEFYRAKADSSTDPQNYLKELIGPLRVVLPLYNEEVHIITRVDSSVRTYSDLKGKRIALGPEDGGSAMTGLSLYRLMFDEKMSVANLVFSSHEDALKAVVDGQVDAWIMVVGQPTTKFTNFSAEAKQLLRFVKFDQNNEVERKILEGPYFSAQIDKESYSWVPEDVPTVAVKAFLISQKYERADTKENITAFTRSLCKNFPALQEKGHEKWRQVELALRDLPGGWEYSEDVVKGFESPECPRDEVTKCKREYELVGLCSTKE